MSSPFFSVQRFRNRWWLVDPSGKRMFYTSVQCVAPEHGSRVPGAPSYNGIRASGGSLKRWIENTEKRLADWGFKGLGAWNHELWRYRDVPFTESLNVWNSLWVDGQLKPVFDTDWEAAADKAIKENVRKHKLAPSLIGYFLDNELPWRPDWLYQYFNERAPSDPNKLEVVSFLRRRHGTIAKLNKAWGTQIGSFKALARLKKLPVDRDHARPDMLAFLGHAAGAYFKIACRLVRKYDPHRPILGVRYAGLPLMEVVRAQRGNTDVVSINIYNQEAELPVAELDKIHGATGQPIWITEFSWHAPFDNRSGTRNTCGFGSRVRYQKSRALGYQRFVEAAARTPFVIGCDWFQWCDESPQGRSDGEDVNFGLLDIHDRPYQDLVRSVRRTNGRVDRLHASPTKSFRSVKPGPVPKLSVPKLSHAPKLARALDGASGIALPGLQMRPSLDPKPARVPAQARVGWNERGLRVDVVVSDAERTVEISKPKKQIEWFWMTDAVELLLRPGPEPAEALDRPSLKVFSVPDGGGKGKPFYGTIRSDERRFGPQTGVSVQQAPIRGGYRMSFWLPAKLLGRAALRPGEELRFNLLVEDCEKVQEVYWSAHQGDWTTERPKTWGLLRLA
ncbi:MAG TPA: hypothetical protein VGJ84_09335 [Polyangiaceae bacterium]